jgi:dihydroorotate dehydrogenase
MAVVDRMPAAVPVMRRLLGADRPELRVYAFGLAFPNPVGLAAGLDKNGVALAAWAALGFGHVEVGTVTPRAQPGQPLPRVFRLRRYDALINRMGFPNDGAWSVASRLAAVSRTSPMVIGGNVGKGVNTPLDRAADDYAAAAEILLPHVDYLAANISSPNTPGLRQLQAPDQVAEIVGRLRPLTTKPVLVKLAPDLDDGVLPDLVAAARSAGASGLIATNTTLARTGVEDDPHAHEAGGLSGPPLYARSLALTRRLVELGGSDLPVISAGGIASATDVHERLDVGAHLVQVYTGLIYGGPGLVGRLLRRR